MVIILLFILTWPVAGGKTMSSQSARKILILTLLAHVVMSPEFSVDMVSFEGSNTMLLVIIL